MVKQKGQQQVKREHYPRRRGDRTRSRQKEKHERVDGGNRRDKRGSEKQCEEQCRSKVVPGATPEQEGSELRSVGKSKRVPREDGDSGVEQESADRVRRPIGREKRPTQAAQGNSECRAGYGGGGGDKDRKERRRRRNRNMTAHHQSCWKGE